MLRFDARSCARSLSFASLLFAVIALGCEPTVTLGPPCDLNSDCEAPLVCTEGHCEVECVHQRDCTVGLHCARIDGIGSCLLDTPLDRTTSPCGPGRTCVDEALVCRDYTCWDGCETSDDCVPGSLCRAGTCANESSSGGAYGVRFGCSPSRPCMEGETCLSHAGSEPTCFRTCASDAECADVAATAICARADAPGVTPTPTVCVIGCDPVRQQGCLENDRCEVSIALTPADPPAYATFFECRHARGTGAQGDRCGTTEPDLDACARGLGCVYAGDDGADFYECREFCRPDETDASCGPGSTCAGRPIDDIQNLDVIGPGTLRVCVPTP